MGRARDRSWAVRGGGGGGKGRHGAVRARHCASDLEDEMLMKAGERPITKAIGSPLVSSKVSLNGKAVRLYFGIWKKWRPYRS